MRLFKSRNQSLMKLLGLGSRDSGRRVRERRRRFSVEVFESRALLNGSWATGVEGMKFLDYNADGVYDAGSDAIPSVPVEIRAYVNTDGNSTLSQSEFNAGAAATALTDTTTGEYFLSLEPGKEYIIVEVIDPNAYSQVPLGQSVLAPGLNTGSVTLGDYGYLADVTYAGTLFSVNTDNSPYFGSIFAVDSASGSIIPGKSWNTTAVTSGVSAPNGLAFDLDGGTLYYSTLGLANPPVGQEFATNAQLWSIDVASGANTLIATLEGSVASGVYHDGHYLYVAQNTGRLFSVDLSSANPTAVEITAFEDGLGADPGRYAFGDIAIKDGVLYGLGLLRGTPDDVIFFSYDLTTNTFVQTPTGEKVTRSIAGAAFGADGQLYGINGANQFLYKFSLEDGSLLSTAALPGSFLVNDMASDLVLSGRDFANYPRGNEGLSHGYWKGTRQHAAAWAATGFSPTDTLVDAFGISATALSDVGISSSTTLIEALGFGGGSGVAGGARNLFKQAVASLLNAAHPEVDYYYTLAEVKSLTIVSVLTKNRASMLALAGTLDVLNNKGATL